MKGHKRGGRKPIPLDIVALCRSHAKEAIEKQIEILRMDAGGDPAILSVQNRAAESLCNRGYGTAPNVVQLQGDVQINITSPFQDILDEE